MSDRDPSGERCRLCGVRLGDDGAVRSADGDRFCSTGCRDVAEALGTGPDPDAASTGESVTTDDDRSTDDDRNADDRNADDRNADDGRKDADTEVAYFRVDGMHAASCEAFLESVAEGRDGVVDAAASYVTEAVRVTYDPDRVSPADLEDALSTLGYTAYRREEAGAGEGDDAGDAGGEAGADDAGGTRRSREMRGLRKRRSDDVLEVRFIVGVVFGSFLLLPYVAIFYPAYLAQFSDWGFLALYQDSFGSLDSMLFLRVFAVLTGGVILLTGMPLLRGAYVAVKLRRPNAQLLATLTVLGAFGYATVAAVVGRSDVYYDLAILVAAAVMGAVYYEAGVKRRAADRLTDLTVSQVDEARRYDEDGSTETVPVGDLASGDRVLVRQGERIPVDGRLVDSSCTVDEAVVTGESVPRTRGDGDPVVGGSVVTNGAAVVAVGEETASSVDRITRAVWDLQSADHGASRRADDLAARATPLVVGAAVAVGAFHLVTGGGPGDVVLAALLTLIAASPWALGLATPLSVATCIRDALERGIVVFDETIFERLRAVDVVVFDKTGTLTTGEMTVLDAAGPPALLRAAAAVERRASHPVAAAVVDAAESGHLTDLAGDAPRPDGGRSDDAAASAHGDSAAAADADVAGDPTVEEFRTHPTGVEGTVDGQQVLVGHPNLFVDRGWSVDSSLSEQVDDARDAGTLPVLVGRDGAAEGVVVLGDEPKPGWSETLTDLGERGLEVVVLTGDDASATDFLREHPAVDHVFAGVSPAGKTATVERLRASGGRGGSGSDDGGRGGATGAGGRREDEATAGEDVVDGGRRVAMVGDGTNDAPALAAADLGVALGSGTALAADAADLAIVESDLGAVERAFALSAAAVRRVERNVWLALGYNAIVIPVAALGLVNPLVTTVAAAAGALALVVNSERALLDE